MMHAYPISIFFMRKLLLSFGLAALLLPVLATAQDTGTAAPLYCPNLSITMQKCAPTRPLSQQRCTDATTEGQVTELQKFLSDYYDLNPADYVSGYFGRLTRDNVRRFQCEKMSICSGDEASTGYGVVGRKTRAAIANACGTETTPPPNNPPPTSPTCTMKATPSTISPGQSSLLSWTSTNANSGTITTLGAVPLYGSQTIFPTQNTTYTGTFWGHQSVATCNASVNVQGQTCQRPNPPAGCHWQSADTCVQDQLICGTTNSCQLDGVEVLNGGIRKFYLYRNQSSSSMCQTYSIDRTCTNGTLSGSTSYQYASCTHTDVETLSCTLDGITKQNGEYHTFYSARTATNCALISLSRACQGTNFTGDSQYQYGSCTNVTGGTPMITINNPPEGASYSIGSSIPVGWTVINKPANSYVRAILRNSSGTSLASFGISANDTESLTRNLLENFSNGTYHLVFELIDNATQNIITSAQRTMYIVSAGTTQPSITITAPPSGTSVSQGSQFVVTWTSQNAPAGSTVALKFGHTCAVTTGQPTAGSFSIGVSNNCSVGQHSLSASLLVNGVPGAIAASQIPMNVTSPVGSTPTITITAPPSGTTVHQGSAVQISWQSQNPPAGSFVTVVMKNPVYYQILGNNLSSTGSQTFTLPAISGSFFLEVILSNSSAKAEVPITLTSY